MSASMRSLTNKLTWQEFTMHGLCIINEYQVGQGNNYLNHIRKTICNMKKIILKNRNNATYGFTRDIWSGDISSFNTFTMPNNIYAYTQFIRSISNFIK